MAKRIVYCSTCGREVLLKRKDFDHKYHEILCFTICLTCGLGIFVYLALKYRKKPNTCPHCETVFDLKNLPKKPEKVQST